MVISKHDYERNCEYEKALQELQDKCEHPIPKRLWYKYGGEDEIIIVCDRCGYSEILGRD